MSETAMTQEELEAKIAALGLPEGDDRVKSIVCSLVGHSRIISMCFGYVYCARCEDQVGDRLVGFYDTTNSVVVGHNCETCRTNYDKLSWQDKFLVSDPFATPEPEEVETDAEPTDTVLRE